MQRALLLAGLLLAGCAAPEGPADEGTGDDQAAPPPCVVYLFTWQDDDPWHVVRAMGNASDTPFLRTPFRHAQTGPHPAWVVFGYWRNASSGWQIQLDADGPHTVSLFDGGHDWTQVKEVPREVHEVMAQWRTVNATWPERLLAAYEDQGMESRTGARMAQVALDPGDIDLETYFEQILPHEPWPPERPWAYAEGAYVLSTPSGNWSLRVPTRWIDGENFRFYQDIWWNGGLEVRQDGVEIVDAWTFLYEFAEDLGFHVPASTTFQGPRPCGSDPRSAY